MYVGGEEFLYRHHDGFGHDDDPTNLRTQC